MEENSAPAGEQNAPQTEANPTNTNSQEQAQEAPKAPNLHGFTEEQLADMAKFYESVGGYEQVKSRLSNPQKYAQPEPTKSQEPAKSEDQETQPQTQSQTQPQEQAPLPKGYASWQELMMAQYFKNLAGNPKYANISEQIENGDIIKEMTAMGMTPIDENYNVNVDQLNQFLALKAASVPAKPTSVEPTNIPTVEYVNADKEITNENEAFQILQQSFSLEQQGLAPHPSKAKAEAFLSGLKQ